MSKTNNIAITIGLSSHRVEEIKSMEKEMGKCNLILLEEPPNPNFIYMLKGELSVEEYLEKVDVSFPKFLREIYWVLRKFYQEGKRVEQVDPYLQNLEALYKAFEGGIQRDKLLQNPPLKEVFLSENKAVKELLRYYYAILQGDFEKSINAVKKFAQADSKRIKIRDKMRAQYIVSRIRDGEYKGSIYIEAGYIHLPLYLYLKRELRSCPVKSVFLMQEPTLTFTKTVPQIYTPGDLLTLRYMFDVSRKEGLEELLAAKSIIYAKLLDKEEKIPSPESPFPHLKEVAELTQLLKKLSYEDCKELFKQILFADRKEALRLTIDYVRRKSNGC